MSVGTPSRSTSMTLEMEKLGWQVTHQGLDHAMWLAGCGQISDLEGHICLPSLWVKDRESTAVVFSDQVPIWLKIKEPLTVFAGHEKVTSSKEARRARGGADKKIVSSDNPVVSEDQ